MSYKHEYDHMELDSVDKNRRNSDKPRSRNLVTEGLFVRLILGRSIVGVTRSMHTKTHGMKRKTG